MATIAHADMLRREASTAFNHAAESYSPLWTDVAITTQSLTAQEKYVFTQNLPSMQTIVGQRRVHDLKSYSWTIENEKWDLTYGIDVDDAADDVSGLLMARAGELGTIAASKPDEMIAYLCENGGSLTCWDGSAFFADSRLSLPTATDNNLALNISDTSVISGSEGKQLIGAAMAALDSFKVEDGVRPRTLGAGYQYVIHCTPGHAAGLREAVNNTSLFGTTTGIDQTFKVVSNPFLSTATYIYVFKCSASNKPFVFQQRSGLEFVMRDDPASDNVFMGNQIQFAVTQRGKVTYRDPRLAVRVTLS